MKATINKVDLKDLSDEDLKRVVLSAMISALEAERDFNYGKLSKEFYSKICTDDFLTGDEAQNLLALISLVSQGMMLRMMMKIGLFSKEDMERILNDVTGGDKNE